MLTTCIYQDILQGEAAVRELLSHMDNNNNLGTTVTVMDGATATQVPVVRRIFYGFDRTYYF